MTRKGYHAAAISDEIAEEDRKFLLKNGARLLENPSALDLYNAWKSLAKKLLKGSPDMLPSSLPANVAAQAGNSMFPQAAPASSSAPPAPVSIDRSQELEVLRRKSQILAQMITLEDRKRKTEYWKAVRSGAVAPPPRMEVIPPKQAAGRVYCRLHSAYHDTWPCEEVKKAALEAGAPIPPPERVTS